MCGGLFPVGVRRVEARPRGRLAATQVALHCLDVHGTTTTSCNNIITGSGVPFLRGRRGDGNAGDKVATTVGDTNDGRGERRATWDVGRRYHR